MIRRKGDRLYVKQKGYDSSFNSWIDKNVHIVKLDDLVNKYNKMYYSITKMKPIDVTSST